MTVRETLTRANACGDMMNWLEGQEPFDSFSSFWCVCPRPDWLTWLIRHVPDEFEQAWSRESVNVLLTVLNLWRCESNSVVNRSGVIIASRVDLLICEAIRTYVTLRRVR